MRFASFSMSAWVLLAPFAAAQDKAAARAELFELDAQYVAARAQGQGAAELGPLLARRDRLRERLGGGDPALQARAAGLSPDSLELESSLASNFTPRATTPLPPGASGAPVSFTRTPNLPIIDGGLVTDSQVVSGLGAYLWDIDLYVDISHTWCGDLELFLVAPSGKRVTIVTDVGEGLVDIFRGTLFDDSPNAPAWAYPHFSGFVSPALNPEGAFHWLAGEDPNGTWTLQVRDDALDDVGVLHQWRLDITALSTPPTLGQTPVIFSNTTPTPIPDFVPVSSTIHVAGQGTVLAEVRLFVNFTHTWNSDVRFDLVSPSGRRARISTYNGGSLDNVFSGTNIFDAMGRVQPTPNPLFDQPVDGYPFVNNVAAIQAQPEGTLTSFLGEDPNGNWRLELLDTVGGFTGMLVNWSLSISTYPPFVPPPIPFCPPVGPSAGGCTPTMSATANPLITHSNVCIITASNLDGDRSGLVFYGASGPTLKSWCAGGAGNSKLCINSPTQRTGAQTTGGTAGQCDGTLVLDWNLYQLNHPAALGNPWLAGSQAHIQGWFRSPSDCKTTFLTQGIVFTYQP